MARNPLETQAAELPAVDISEIPLRPRYPVIIEGDDVTGLIKKFLAQLAQHQASGASGPLNPNDIDIRLSLRDGVYQWIPACAQKNVDLLKDYLFLAEWIGECNSLPEKLSGSRIHLRNAVSKHNTEEKMKLLAARMQEDKNRKLALHLVKRKNTIAYLERFISESSHTDFIPAKKLAINLALVSLQKRLNSIQREIEDLSDFLKKIRKAASLSEQSIQQKALADIQALGAEQAADNYRATYHQIWAQHCTLESVVDLDQKEQAQLQGYLFVLKQLQSSYESNIKYIKDKLKNIDSASSVADNPVPARADLDWALEKSVVEPDLKAKVLRKTSVDQQDGDSRVNDLKTVIARWSADEYDFLKEKIFAVDKEVVEKAIALHEKKGLTHEQKMIVDAVILLRIHWFKEKYRFINIPSKFQAIENAITDSYRDPKRNTLQVTFVNAINHVKPQQQRFLSLLEQCHGELSQLFWSAVDGVSSEFDGLPIADVSLLFEEVMRIEQKLIEIRSRLDEEGKEPKSSSLFRLKRQTSEELDGPLAKFRELIDVKIGQLLVAKEKLQKVLHHHMCSHYSLASRKRNRVWLGPVIDLMLAIEQAELPKDPVTSDVFSYEVNKKVQVLEQCAEYQATACFEQSFNEALGDYVFKPRAQAKKSACATRPFEKEIEQLKRISDKESTPLELALAHPVKGSQKLLLPIQMKVHEGTGLWIVDFAQPNDPDKDDVEQHLKTVTRSDNIGHKAFRLRLVKRIGKRAAWLNFKLLDLTQLEEKLLGFDRPLSIFIKENNAEFLCFDSLAQIDAEFKKVFDVLLEMQGHVPVGTNGRTHDRALIQRYHQIFTNKKRFIDEQKQSVIACLKEKLVCEFKEMVSSNAQPTCLSPADFSKFQEKLAAIDAATSNALDAEIINILLHGKILDSEQGLYFPRDPGLPQKLRSCSPRFEQHMDILIECVKSDERKRSLTYIKALLTRNISEAAITRADFREYRQWREPAGGRARATTSVSSRKQVPDISERPRTQSHPPTKQDNPLLQMKAAANCLRPEKPQEFVNGVQVLFGEITFDKRVSLCFGTGSIAETACLSDGENHQFCWDFFMKLFASDKQHVETSGAFKLNSESRFNLSVYGAQPTPAMLKTLLKFYLSNNPDETSIFGLLDALKGVVEDNNCFDGSQLLLLHAGEGDRFNLTPYDLISVLVERIALLQEGNRLEAKTTIKVILEAYLKKRLDYLTSLLSDDQDMNVDKIMRQLELSDQYLVSTYKELLGPESEFHRVFADAAVHAIAKISETYGFMRFEPLIFLLSLVATGEQKIALLDFVFDKAMTMLAGSSNDSSEFSNRLLAISHQLLSNMNDTDADIWREEYARRAQVFLETPQLDSKQYAFCVDVFVAYASPKQWVDFVKEQMWQSLSKGVSPSDIYLEVKKLLNGNDDQERLALFWQELTDEAADYHVEIGDDERQKKALYKTLVNMYADNDSQFEVRDAILFDLMSQVKSVKSTCIKLTIDRVVDQIKVFREQVSDDFLWIFNFDHHYTEVAKREIKDVGSWLSGQKAYLLFCVAIDLYWIDEIDEELFIGVAIKLLKDDESNLLLHFLANEKVNEYLTGNPQALEKALATPLSRRHTRFRDWSPVRQVLEKDESGLRLHHLNWLEAVMHADCYDASSDDVYFDNLQWLEDELLPELDDLNFAKLKRIFGVDVTAWLTAINAFLVSGRMYDFDSVGNLSYLLIQVHLAIYPVIQREPSLVGVRGRDPVKTFLDQPLIASQYTSMVYSAINSLITSKTQDFKEHLKSLKTQSEAAANHTFKAYEMLIRYLLSICKSAGVFDYKAVIEVCSDEYMPDHIFKEHKDRLSFIAASVSQLESKDTIEKAKKSLLEHIATFSSVAKDDPGRARFYIFDFDIARLQFLLVGMSSQDKALVKSSLSDLSDLLNEKQIGTPAVTLLDELQKYFSLDSVFDSSFSDCASTIGVLIASERARKQFTKEVVVKTIKALVNHQACGEGSLQQQCDKMMVHASVVFDEQDKKDLSVYLFQLLNSIATDSNPRIADAPLAEGVQQKYLTIGDLVKKHLEGYQDDFKGAFFALRYFLLQFKTNSTDELLAHIVNKATQFLQRELWFESETLLGNGLDSPDRRAAHHFYVAAQLLLVKRFGNQESFSYFSALIKTVLYPRYLRYKVYKERFVNDEYSGKFLRYNLLESLFVISENIEDADVLILQSEQRNSLLGLEAAFFASRREEQRQQEFVSSCQVRWASLSFCDRKRLLCGDFLSELMNAKSTHDLQLFCQHFYANPDFEISRFVDFCQQQGLTDTVKYRELTYRLQLIDFAEQVFNAYCEKCPDKVGDGRILKQECLIIAFISFGDIKKASKEMDVLNTLVGGDQGKIHYPLLLSALQNDLSSGEPVPADPKDAFTKLLVQKTQAFQRHCVRILKQSIQPIYEYEKLKSVVMCDESGLKCLKDRNYVRNKEDVSTSSDAKKEVITADAAGMQGDRDFTFAKYKIIVRLEVMIDDLGLELINPGDRSRSTMVASLHQVLDFLNRLQSGEVLPEEVELPKDIAYQKRAKYPDCKQYGGRFDKPSCDFYKHILVRTRQSVEQAYHNYVVQHDRALPVVKVNPQLLDWQPAVQQEQDQSAFDQRASVL